MPGPHQIADAAGHERPARPPCCGNVRGVVGREALVVRQLRGAIDQVAVDPDEALARGLEDQVDEVARASRERRRAIATSATSWRVRSSAATEPALITREAAPLKRSAPS